MTTRSVLHLHTTLACGVLAAAMLATGCTTSHANQPADTEPTSTYSDWWPTASSTPTVTPSPTRPPWTATPASPQLYSQAFDVYNTFIQEYFEIRSAGGMDELPPGLAKILTGDAAKVVLALFRDQKATRVWDGTPQFAVTATAPVTDHLPDGTLVALEACEDTWGAAVFDKQGHEITDGGDFTDVSFYYFQRNDSGDLVIFQVGYLGKLGTNGGTPCPLS
jgi:hypothetical protein